MTHVKSCTYFPSPTNITCTHTHTPLPSHLLMYILKYSLTWLPQPSTYYSPIPSHLFPSLPTAPLNPLSVPPSHKPLLPPPSSPVSSSSHYFHSSAKLPSMRLLIKRSVLMRKKISLLLTTPTLLPKRNLHLPVDLNFFFTRSTDGNFILFVVTKKDRHGRE